MKKKFEVSVRTEYADVKVVCEFRIRANRLMDSEIETMISDMADDIMKIFPGARHINAPISSLKVKF